MKIMNRKGLSTFETVAIIVLVVLVVLIIVDSSSTGAGVVKSFFANILPDKLGILPKESAFQIEEGPGIVMYNLLDDSVNYRKDKMWNKIEREVNLGSFTVNKGQIYADFSSYWYAQQLRDPMLEGNDLRIAPTGSNDFLTLPKLTERPELIKGPDAFNGVNSKLASYIKVDYGVGENKKTYFMSFDKKLYQFAREGLIFFSVKNEFYTDSKLSSQTQADLARIATFGNRGIDLVSKLGQDLVLPGEEFELKYDGSQEDKNKGIYDYSFYKNGVNTKITLRLVIQSRDSSSITYRISVRTYNKEEKEVTLAYTESTNTAQEHLSEKLSLTSNQKVAFVNALVDWRDYIVKKPIQLNYGEVSGINVANYFCVVYIKDKGMLAVDLRKPVEVSKECI
ncbi:MAG: hypothetical protein AABW82_03895 [Nanoarchaeota archaeon]